MQNPTRAEAALGGARLVQIAVLLLYFLTINVFSIPNVQSGLTFWM